MINIKEFDSKNQANTLAFTTLDTLQQKNW